MTAAFTPLWIKFQKSKRVGQIVRTDGPSEHLVKQGTPTMGGLIIIFSVLVVYYLLGGTAVQTYKGGLALGLLIACGMLGFIDDITMVINARSLGLKARYKMLLTFIITVVFGYLFFKTGNLSTVINIPLTASAIDIGWLYFPFLFLIIAGFTNSVNLADGLDGLAAGTITIVLLAYAGIAFKQGRLDLALYAAAASGASIGFLWYNAYPAEIFLGDTGSFALGGALCAMAILTKTEALLILIGGIYVIEALSVIIQVGFYRYTKRRIFKMAPIHHHFEVLGWSETKVMIRFWIVSGLLAGAGFALYFITALKAGGK